MSEQEVVLPSHGRALATLPEERPLVPAEPLRVIALPRPFSFERQELSLPQGLTLQEIIVAAGIVPDQHVRVWIDDVQIARKWWPHMRPRAGHLVTLRVIPMGGEGGGQKSTGRIVGLIAITILAAVATALTYGALGPTSAVGLSALYAGAIAGGVGAAVSIGGGLLLNALIPIQQAKLDSMSQPDSLVASPTYSLQGARNRLTPYAKIPRPLGWHRMTPPAEARA